MIVLRYLVITFGAFLVLVVLAANDSITKDSKKVETALPCTKYSIDLVETRNIGFMNDQKNLVAHRDGWMECLEAFRCRNTFELVRGHSFDPLDEQTRPFSSELFADNFMEPRLNRLRLLGFEQCRKSLADQIQHVGKEKLEKCLIVNIPNSNFLRLELNSDEFNDLVEYQMRELKQTFRQ